MSKSENIGVAGVGVLIAAGITGMIILYNKSAAGENAAVKGVDGIPPIKKGMIIVTVVDGAQVRTTPSSEENVIMSALVAGSIIGTATGNVHKDEKNQQVFIQVMAGDEQTRNKHYPVWVDADFVKGVSAQELQGEIGKGQAPHQHHHVDQHRFNTRGGRVGIYAYDGDQYNNMIEIVANSPVVIISEDLSQTANVNAGTKLGHPIQEIDTAGGKFITFRSNNGILWHVKKDNVTLKNV